MSNDRQKLFTINGTAIDAFPRISFASFGVS